ncbi:hypothetical protein T484DRAFT_2171369 [Baffinella frigidus]|nr:hypothetical protein T484DRAFT_2171369 [Cryptophyta sp. CCMP2293]
MLSDIITPQATEEMYEQTLHKDPNDLDTWYTFARFLWKVRGDLDASEGALLKILGTTRRRMLSPKSASSAPRSPPRPERRLTSLKWPVGAYALP